ncbi:MAG: hypothetical protein ABII97_01430 [Patescibacteria group bacterium]
MKLLKINFRLTIGILVVVLVSLYFFLVDFNETSLPGLNMTRIPDSIATSTSKIYMTLAPKKSDNVGIYAFNFATQKIEEIYAPHHDVVITSGISLDGNKIVASSNYYSEDKSIYQFYLLDYSEGKKKIKQITESDTFSKREPSWAPDGKKFAFMAQDSRRELSMILADWSVYVTDLEGNEVFVTKGAHPLFLPDGRRLLVLKEDGLYLFDVDSMEGEIVLALEEGKAVLNKQLDLSWSGKMLAWSFPRKGEMVLFKINSWEPFDLRMSHRINISAFWPTFSLDGRQLVVEEVDWDENKEEPEKPRLVYFDLKTMDKDFLIDLDDYKQDFMWIDGWR